MIARIDNMTKTTPNTVTIKTEPGTFTGQVLQLNAQTLAALQSAGVQPIQIDSSTAGSLFGGHTGHGQSISQIIQIPNNISHSALLSSLQAAASPGQKIIIQTLGGTPVSQATTQGAQPQVVQAVPVQATASSQQPNSAGVPVQIAVNQPNGQVSYQTIHIPWSVLQQASPSVNVVANAGQAVQIVNSSSGASTLTTPTASSSSTNHFSAAASRPSVTISLHTSSSGGTTTTTNSTPQIITIKADDGSSGVLSGAHLTTVQANQLTPILIQHNGQLVQAYNVTGAIRAGNMQIQGLTGGQGTIQVSMRAVHGAEKHAAWRYLEITRIGPKELKPWF